MAKELLIAAFIPSFAERDASWFEENARKIKDLSRHDVFWSKNVCFAKEGRRIALSEFLRRLDDLGYEKTQDAAAPGEYSARGGAVVVFPINLTGPVRLEFLGNRIEKITLNLPRAAGGAGLPREKRERLILKEMLKREISHLHNLKEGDYVVHIDHGIGIFKGITDNYYFIEYAPPKEGKDPDRLLVPEAQAKRLSLYVGFQKPVIHRLSSSSWEHTKKKISEDAQKFARELLAIYAKRHVARRPPYPRHQHEQSEFDALFEYLETDDQKKAIEGIFSDLDKEEPMDHLLCGDVGFGKTEMAMRTAFRAVHSGKQAAVLCPTTVLADQHYETFRERFARFPVNIGILSRFENKKMQKETVNKLREGKIDIIIGTHRLLSSDVGFKNIGLLIIDEEQRFGVRQKEKIKKMREEVDVLSLSATPIPRTLYLALSGLRRVSVINTPPFGRVPIDTFVLPYNKEIIQKAIREELRRKGQVYFLHNKIETMEKTRGVLRELVPEARFETVHGKTPETNLRAVMNRFKQKQCDVLISTTIIENGLDIKNANTLIVDDATRLGLAQAYQIRGRIGRADKKARAYFLYPKKSLTDDAKKRLETLESATELGSGYYIAQKDLEIRGAGNILGKQQSGAVNQVGLNLYCQILAEAVEKLTEAI